MDNPKLSIITINLNNASGLRKTIESVISQTFSDFEYIIIDGGSTDGSVDVIKEYSDKITYWVSEPDKGIYNAMNKGIEKATGEYCIFMNSGDCLFNNTIVEEVFKQENNLGYDIIYGNLQRTFTDNTIDIVLMPVQITPKFLIESTLCHQITFIRRDLFCRFGKYREDLQVVSDWAFFLKVIVFANTTRHYIDKVICNFRMDGLSSNPKNQKLIANEREKVIDEYFSNELLTICNDFPKYKDFHGKKIFRILRNIRAGLFNIFNKRTYTKNFAKKRNIFLLTILSKKIRRQIRNPLSIPIIIINYNRLEYLKILLRFLFEREHTKIIVIDNNSDYIPLLDYYEEIKEKVSIIRLEDNFGHEVFWKLPEVYNKFSDGYYIVTDSDIIPNINLPKDYLNVMVKLLNNYPDITKVGFALRIDDIPKTYSLREIVINWEKKFWEDEVEMNVYKSPIDTTFAIYYPYYHPVQGDFYKALRIGGVFCAQHGGWYINYNSLTYEQRHYILTANKSNTWKTDLNGNLINFDNNYLASNIYSE